MSQMKREDLQFRAMAAAAERRNRPVGLLVIAIALLIVSSVFTLWSASAVARARREITDAETGLQNVKATAERIEQVRTRPEKDPFGDRYRADPEMLRKLERVPERAGLEARPTLREESRPRPLALDSPFQSKIVNVRFGDSSLQDVMKWINQALMDVPGLHVTSAEFTVPSGPSGRGWVVDLKLARWEIKP